jgi:hypothetical protein
MGKKTRHLKRQPPPNSKTDEPTQSTQSRDSPVSKQSAPSCESQGASNYVSLRAGVEATNSEGSARHRATAPTRSELASEDGEENLRLLTNQKLLPQERVMADLKYCLYCIYNGVELSKYIGQLLSLKKGLSAMQTPAFGVN